MSDKHLLLPSLSGWYGPTAPESKVCVMDGARPRQLESRPVVIGEELRMDHGPHGELSGRLAHTLAAALGVTYETFLCLFARVNLLRHWSSKEKPRMASLRVMASGYESTRDLPIVLVGRRACQAFGFTPGNYEWSDLGQAPCVAIPQPGVIWHPDDVTKADVAKVLERALLYHGKVFRIGDYPHGDGSLVMIAKGNVWGDAARRLKHRKD